MRQTCYGLLLNVTIFYKFNRRKALAINAKALVVSELEGALWALFPSTTDKCKKAPSERSGGVFRLDSSKFSSKFLSYYDTQL